MGHESYIVMYQGWGGVGHKSYIVMYQGWGRGGSQELHSYILGVRVGWVTRVT